MASAHRSGPADAGPCCPERFLSSRSSSCSVRVAVGCRSIGQRPQRDQARAMHVAQGPADGGRSEAAGPRGRQQQHGQGAACGHFAAEAQQLAFGVSAILFHPASPASAEPLQASSGGPGTGCRPPWCDPCWPLEGRTPGRWPGHSEQKCRLEARRHRGPEFAETLLRCSVLLDQEAPGCGNQASFAKAPSAARRLVWRRAADAASAADAPGLGSVGCKC